MTCELFWHVLMGLDCLHDRGLSRQDLKPENLLVFKNVTQQPIIKLTDFGHARGTVCYLDPTILSGEPSCSTSSVDMWALGCIFSEMVLGYHPFAADTDDCVLERILQSLVSSSSRNA